MNKLIAFGLLASVGTAASAQLQVVYSQDWVAPEGTVAGDFVDALGLEFVGNGDEGAGFFDGSVPSPVLQAYGTRQVEIGIGSFPLAGVTLEAGTEYTFNLVVTEDFNNWSLAQDIRFGLNEASNRPSTPAAFAEAAFDFPFAIGENRDPDNIDLGAVPADGVRLPQSNDGIEGPFQAITFTYTPAADIVEPLFMFATTVEAVDLFLNARMRLISVEITTGEDTMVPACPADQNFDGILNGADFNAWLSNFAAGCP